METNIPIPYATVVVYKDWGVDIANFGRLKTKMATINCKDGIIKSVVNHTNESIKINGTYYTPNY